MPLLLKAQFFDIGKKRRVEIDIHEVFVIRSVLSGKRVHGPVRGSKRVHECAEAALQHGEKRITHRKLFGAA